MSEAHSIDDPTAAEEHRVADPPVSNSSAIVAGIPDAVRRGDALYLSGHVGTDQPGRSICDAARAMFSNLQRSIEEAGFRLCDVVSATIFIACAADFDQLNIAWNEFFPQPCPARTTVGATFPSPAIRFEVTAIAHRAHRDAAAT